MWHLGLSSESYPERPGVPNCVYYMRTGFCGYGSRCRYNHPRDRAAVNSSHKFSCGNVFSVLIFAIIFSCLMSLPREAEKERGLQFVSFIYFYWILTN